MDCTGSPTGLVLAMQLVRPRGKIIVKSAAAPVPPSGLRGAEGVDLSPLVCNELEVIGARCGKIADGLAALAKGEVETNALVTGRVKFADAVRGLRLAQEPGSIKVLIDV